jgi:hypothetical protein
LTLGTTSDFRLVSKTGIWLEDPANALSMFSRIGKLGIQDIV